MDFFIPSEKIHSFLHGLLLTCMTPIPLNPYPTPPLTPTLVLSALILSARHSLTSLCGDFKEVLANKPLLTTTYCWFVRD